MRFYVIYVAIPALNRGDFEFAKEGETSDLFCQRKQCRD